MKDESSGIAAYKEPRFAFPMGHGGAIRGGGMGSKKKKREEKGRKEKEKNRSLSTRFCIGTVLPDATSFAAPSPHSSPLQ